MERKSHPYWPTEESIPTALDRLRSSREHEGGKLAAPPNDNNNNPQGNFTITKLKETKAHDLIARDIEILAENGEKKTFVQLHYNG